jgi:hypothetical protein
MPTMRGPLPICLGESVIYRLWAVESNPLDCWNVQRKDMGTVYGWKEACKRADAMTSGNWHIVVQPA